MTLRTVSDIFFGLGCKVVFDAFVEGEASSGFVPLDSLAFVNWVQTPDLTAQTQLDNYQHIESELTTMAA